MPWNRIPSALRRRTAIVAASLAVAGALIPVGLTFASAASAAVIVKTAQATS
jgi:uncharacterized membrane protein YjfL (UPF0719 family)